MSPAKKTLGNCPFCSGRRVDLSNCLATLFPSITKEWDYNKNNLTPYDVTAKSNKKVWWICSERHEYESTVANRTRTDNGTKCPFCIGQKVNETNSLAKLMPNLAKQWHPTKNNILTPNNVTITSNNRVWWLCDRGHEWQSYISNRKKKEYGCPYCSGRNATKENCLATINPDLAKQWHPSRNGTITPFDVTPSSGKKIWWLGKCGHEWDSKIDARAKGYGCPYCSNQRLCLENSLGYLNPKLAEEWHPTLNKNVTPYDVMSGAGKRVWWKCKSKGHEWQAAIVDRNGGTECPYCTNKKICIDNCLVTIRPDIAKEWNKEKNESITPYDVFPNSTRKIWWICSIGHEWRATANSRYSQDSGCPVCNESKGEKRIYNFLLKHKINHIRQYRIKECRNRYPLPFDFAIFNLSGDLESLIEYDGEQHENPRDVFGGKKQWLRTQENDQIKTEFCLKNNIALIRISYNQYEDIETILENRLNKLFKITDQTGE